MKSEKKYTQYDADYMYVAILTGNKLNKDTHTDCQRIRNPIKLYRDIQLSIPGTYKFWSIISTQQDIKWLPVREGDDGDMDVLDIWDKFINDWYKEEDDTDI